MNAAVILRQLCFGIFVAMPPIWAAELPTAHLATSLADQQQVSFVLEDARKQHTIEVIEGADILAFKQAVAAYLTRKLERPITVDQLTVMGRFNRPCYDDSADLSNFMKTLGAVPLVVLIGSNP
jgi:hypothetical protein